MSSCYDCIRDYSNQNVHGLLDWRLGLDIARLAKDSNAKIDFSINYWSYYIFKTTLNVLNKNGYSTEISNGTLKGNDPFGNPYVLIHPLWSNTFIEKIVNQTETECVPLSIFDVSRLNIN